MVAVKKKQRNGKTYYYLQHSYRVSGKVQTTEKYLGKELPKDLEKLKGEFELGIKKERWYGRFDRIRENHLKQGKLTPGPAREKETENFGIRFTYDSQRIEGSTLTLRETADLLERGITPPSRPLRDVKEAEAHQKLFLEMLNHKKDLTFQIVLEWHKKLLWGTKPEIAGKIREHQVSIGGSRFLPPLPAEVYPMLREFFSWYDKNKGKLYPVELAALVHLKFVTIHPFADGNGRISRLLMNFVLQKHSYPMLNIRYEKRTGYYNALEKSQLSGVDAPFLNWFFKRYIKENH